MQSMKEWKINQFLAGCIITFGGFGFGTALSWTATALPKLEKTGLVTNLTSQEISWIASVMPIGALLACPITIIFLRDHGRKTSLLIYCGISFIGWLLIASAVNPIQIYFGRTLVGISSGGYTILIPIYVSEMASKENRGFIGSMFLIMLCLGKLFSNVVGIIFPIRISSVICSLPCIIYGVLLIPIPESPKIFMNRNKEKEALEALHWFEAKGIKQFFTFYRNIDIPQSRQVMSKKRPSVFVMSRFSDTASVDLPEELNGHKHRLRFSGEVIKPLITVFLEMMLAQFCGINVSTFYTVEIFRISGDTLIDSELATVIVALVQTVGCIPCSIFVDKYGRRVLLISSFLFMAIAMGVFSAFFFFIETVGLNTLKNYPQLGLTPLLSLIIYNLAYAWGVGSVLWIITSEILPPNIIRAASAIANIIFWSSAFITLQSFQIFKTKVPMYTWFISFAVVCTFGAIFNFIFLPETKGLSLEEVQTFYKAKGHLKTEKSAKNNQDKV